MRWEGEISNVPGLWLVIIILVSWSLLCVLALMFGDTSDCIDGVTWKKGESEAAGSRRSVDDTWVADVRATFAGEGPTNMDDGERVVSTVPLLDGEMARKADVDVVDEGCVLGERPERGDRVKALVVDMESVGDVETGSRLMAGMTTEATDDTDEVEGSDVDRKAEAEVVVDEEKVPLSSSERMRGDTNSGITERSPNAWARRSSVRTVPEEEVGKEEEEEEKEEEEEREPDICE